jgi:NAD(P)-dependent dehydrogenase (short-subunit alcohol dehydrogenase family)
MRAASRAPQVALITGGGSGIGLEITRQLGARLRGCAAARQRMHHRSRATRHTLPARSLAPLKPAARPQRCTARGA